MSFLGADTDQLREAGQKCQDGKEQVDQVIEYLRALIMALRAAAFFTGGASAAYADYLEGTVLPWLQRISQALGLMAKVLMSNAQAQDDVSDGRTVDLGSLPSYTSPAADAPARIQPWEGQLVPAGGFGAVGQAAGTDAGDAPSGDRGEAGTGADSVGDHSALGALGAPIATGAAGTGPLRDDSVLATPSALGALGGPGGQSAFGAPAALGGQGILTAAHERDATGLDAPASGHGSLQGAAGPIGGGFGGALGGGSGGLLGSGSGTGDTGLTPLGELTSYAAGGLSGSGLGAPLGDSHAGSGAAAPIGTPVAADAEQPSYGAAAGIAGGAAALGVGGAALAARGGGQGDARVDQLGTTHGRGSRGEDVRELQERLTAAGYDTRGADGVWGRDTQTAYDAYRQAHPLEVRHGSGYTSPTGFDYNQVTGVRGNANVSPEFLREVEGVAQRIGARPEHLMAVMSFETGGEFGADTPTKAPNGTAVGLIQFTPPAREQVGATREQLMAMTPTQQLAYVEKYFETRRGPHLGTVEGLYSAVLGGTGHTDPDRVMFREGDRAWEGNKGLDTAPRNGEVTVSEAAQRVRNALAGR